MKHAPAPARRAARLMLWLLLAALLLACRGRGAAPDAPPATPSGAAGTQTLLVLPDDGVQPLLDLIGSAQQSIRLKIYLFTYRDLRSALTQAAARGVAVRVLIEQTPVEGAESNLEAYNFLRQGGVDVRWTPPTFRLTHEKTIVIDDSVALTGTFNYTVSSFSSNREYGLLLRDPALVRQIAALFDADWAGQPYQIAAGSPLVISPSNSRSTLLALIDEARQSLWLQQSTLLDDEITAHLMQAARRGVEVRFIGPLRQEEQDLAEPNYAQIAQAGAQVVRLVSPTVHAKVVLVDGRKALIGSINLTYSSLDLNRELGLITTQADVIARLRRTLESDWAQARAQPSAPVGLVDWRQAGDYVGAEITVEGEIVRTYDSGKVTFLNFSQDYRNTLSLVIFASDYDRYPRQPAELFLRQTVRAHGLVKLYEGAPEIILSSPDQIEILGGQAQAAETATATVVTAPTIPPAASAPPPATAGQPVAWQDAGAFVGQEIIVEGQIVRTHDTGKVTFLNFTDDWRGTLSIVIFASAYAAFPTPPVQFFRDQFVRVRGRVKEYQGAPEIVVESPDQIQVLTAAPASSPAAPPAAAATAPPTGVVPWQQAENYLGQTITVSGRVVRAHDTGNITFLNFSSARDQFVAVIFAEDYDRFPSPPAALFADRQVWITGEIALYQGTPQIVITHPDQIEVFE